MKASILGVSRDKDNEKSLIVAFDKVPTDDELRMVHEVLQSNEYAWKNVHILERARQEQDKKYEALINRLLEGSDGIHGDWMVSEIEQLLETLK